MEKLIKTDLDQSAPILTIIIPVFNAENYLEDCLNSIIRQDLTCFEVICVDDLSTDQSCQIIENFSKKDSRIRLIRPTAKGSAGGARNIGIKQSKGKYIQFIDADDTIEPNSLGELIRYAETNKADMVVFDNNFVLNDIKAKRSYNFVHCETLTNNKDFVKFALTNDPEIWRRLFIATLLKNNNLFFEENVFYEDVLYSVQTSYYCRSMVVFKKRIYNYHKRSDSVTFKFDLESMTSKLTVISNLYDFLVEKGFYNLLKDEFKNRVWSMYDYHLNNLNRSNLTKEEKIVAQKRFMQLFFTSIIYANETSHLEKFKNMITMNYYNLSYFKKTILKFKFLKQILFKW